MTVVLGSPRVCPVEEGLGHGWQQEGWSLCPTFPPGSICGSQGCQSLEGGLSRQ